LSVRYPTQIQKNGQPIEAFKKLDREHATIVKMTNDDARLWDIAESLHRAELSAGARRLHPALVQRGSSEISG
jgi:hypothetical protein